MIKKCGSVAVAPQIIMHGGGGGEGMNRDWTYSLSTDFIFTDRHGIRGGGGGGGGQGGIIRFFFLYFCLSVRRTVMCVDSDYENIATTFFRLQQMCQTPPPPPLPR